MSHVIIKKLKQPKVSSGKELKTGETVKIKGLLIKNENKYNVCVSTYDRDPKRGKAV